MNIIDQLYQVLQERKSANAQKSYVASLYEKGAPKISEKIREEAQEVIAEIMALEKDAYKKDVRESLKNEAADLIFHLWVALAHYDITPQDIAGVLEKRFGTSGHEEKASRGKKS
ncbi:MAG: phosphoribosyl-ATP diphosphatase [Alphaproteobacteria bacterium]